MNIPFGLAAALIAAAVALPVTAQTAPTAGPAPVPYISADEVSALIAKAAKERKPDQAIFVQPLVRLAPYNATLEYRALAGPAAVHAKEAELFYVVEGSGVLVTGGKLTGETPTANTENQIGAGIAGGDSRKVSKGDVIFVPEGVPHWISSVNGALVLMSLHVPREAAPR